MPDRHDLYLPAFLALLAAAWVGHACVWTFTLNNLYGRRLSKRILKPFRLFVGVVIAAAPLIFLSAFRFDFLADDYERVNGLWGRAVLGYAVLCAGVGLVVFPLVTLYRLLRPKPTA